VGGGRNTWPRAPPCRWVLRGSSSASRASSVSMCLLRRDPSGSSATSSWARTTPSSTSATSASGSQRSREDREACACRKGRVKMRGVCVCRPAPGGGDTWQPSTGLRRGNTAPQLRLRFDGSWGAALRTGYRVLECCVVWHDEMHRCVRQVRVRAGTASTSGGGGSALLEC
jgi:hypothetical protein